MASGWRRGGGVGLKLLPVTVLVAMVAVALVVRLRSPHRTPPSRGATQAEVLPLPEDASVAGGLGGSLPEKPARVPARAAMQHGDMRRTHRAKGHLPRAPRIAWTFATAGPIQAQVTTSPDESTLYVASLDGTVTALGRDGIAKWRVTLGDRIYGTPCVADDGTVYVGSDAKKFVALAPDGRVKWRLETEGEADTGAAWDAASGRVVFAAGSAVYAVRPRGDVAWKFHAKRKVFTAPAVGEGGTVYFGSQDHHVYALHPNGVLAWSVDLGADVDGAPAIADDGAIFVGTDAGDVVKLTPNGQVAWRTPLGGYVRGPLAIARNGDVLAGVFGPTPREVRITDDGRLRGELAIQGTGARDFGIMGGALEDDDGALVFGAQDDVIYAVDVSGALRWRYTAGADVDAPLTLLSDGSVVAASDDGKVYFFVP